MHYIEIEREWDEAEEPKEALPEDSEEDYPTGPVSPREQRQIMGDLQRSLTMSKDQGDEARVFYTQEAIGQLKSI